MTDMAVVRREAGDFAAAVAHRVIDEIRQPEQQAALAGAIILPLVVCRGRVPSLPALMILALIGDYAGRMAYRASADLRTIAEAARGGA